MAKKKDPRPDRVIIKGVPHKLVLFEVTGLFPNGKFRHVKRITEEATVNVATPKPKWFITAYVQETSLNYSNPDCYVDPKKE